MIDKNGEIITQIARSGMTVSMLVVLASCGGGQTTVQDVKRQTMTEMFEAETEALKAAPHAQPSDAEARFPYELDEVAKEAPFLVEAMWNDGRFTYLRTSDAQKRLVLWQKIANVPQTIPYTRTDDGLYIVHRVVTRDGWFNIGSETAPWRITPPKR